MTFLTDVSFRLRALFRRDDMDADLAAELEHHLATQAGLYERAGMAPGEARRRARVDLGGLDYVSEVTRDVRGISIWETTMQDIRYAMRGLLRTPSFTIAAVVALGLGIGSATTVFSMLEAVVLRPLPYRDPQRLVTPWEMNLAKGLQHELMSPVNFVDYRALTSTFSDAAGWWRTEFVLGGDGGIEPIRVNGVEATTNVLDVLGVKPFLGQPFSGDSILRATSPQMLISYRLWRTHFGGDPGVVGEGVRLNGRGFTVIGVMPEGFNFPGKTDLWQGLQWSLAQHNRGAHFWEGIARLAPGVNVERANRDLAALTARLGASFKVTNAGWSARVVRLDHEVSGAFRPALFALLGASGLLLLIACINVANLLLARSTTRRREVALRSAIGASRSRVARLFLTESALLAVAGAILGCAIATVAVRGLLAWSPVAIPRAEDIGVNGWVLLFSTLITAATALAFGLAPSAAAAKTELVDALRDGTRGTAAASRRTRGTLVVVEVALAVTLLAGAGLMMRSVSSLLDADVGVDARSVVTGQVQLPDGAYRDIAKADLFFDRLTAALRSRSEIASVGIGYYLPLDVAYRLPFTLAGAPPLASGAGPTAQFHSVDHGFFGVLRAGVVSGRSFTRNDDAGAVPVVVVNQAFAKQHFPAGDAIGKRFVTDVRVIGPLGERIARGNEHEIVGIVRDVKNTSLREAAEPAVYFSARQFPYRTMHVIMRGRAADEAEAQLAAVLREEVRRLDRGLAVGEVRPLERVLASTIDPPRLIRMLLAVFAALALTLAAVGIYGILTFTVAERRREMSLRIALGAAPRGVLWMVVRQGLVLALVGFALGALGAGLAGQSISAFLYEVTAWDPVTIGGVLLVLLVVAGTACLAPGWHASREDPVRALRAD